VRSNGGPDKGKTILVVDDEPLIAEGLATALRLDGYDADTAGNGAVALEKLQGGIYDLILCDVKMPVLDGPSLYREVKRRHPAFSRRFVFFTGAWLDVETTELFQESQIPYLRKPFRFDELLGVVKWALDKG